MARVENVSVEIMTETWDSDKGEVVQAIDPGDVRMKVCVYSLKKPRVKNVVILDLTEGMAEKAADAACDCATAFIRRYGEDHDIVATRANAVKALRDEVETNKNIATASPEIINLLHKEATHGQN